MFKKRLGAGPRLGRGLRWLAVPAMAAGLVAGSTGQAGAFIIDGTTNVDDTFTVLFELVPGGTDNGGNTLPGTKPLTAEIVYTVNTIDLDATGEVKFTIDIKNTSPDDPAFTNDGSITSFGLFTDPDAAVSSFMAGSTFSAFAEDTTFPSFQQIDICIFADGCAGGDYKNALAPGEMDTVMIVLGGDLSGGSLTVDPTVVKYQGDRGSYQFAGNGNGTTVPEAQTIYMFLVGLGLLGLVSMLRRGPRQILPLPAYTSAAVAAN